MEQGCFSQEFITISRGVVQQEVISIMSVMNNYFLESLRSLNCEQLMWKLQRIFAVWFSTQWIKMRTADTHPTYFGFYYMIDSYYIMHSNFILCYCEDNCRDHSKKWSVCVMFPPHAVKVNADCWKWEAKWIRLHKPLMISLSLYSRLWYSVLHHIRLC